MAEKKAYPLRISSDVLDALQLLGARRAAQLECADRICAARGAAQGGEDEAGPEEKEKESG